MAAPATQLGPQTIANAFVDQYYHILNRSPEHVYKFYNDLSIMSRPDDNGEMSSVTTMKAINDKIISSGFSRHYVKIDTVDSQLSYNNGVFIVVTGVSSLDNVQRKFAQSFFLAPQDQGYYVLNDLFRFMSASEPVPLSSQNENGSITQYPVASEQEPAIAEKQDVPEQPTVVPEVTAQKAVEVAKPAEHSSSRAEAKTNANQPVKVNPDQTRVTKDSAVQTKQMNTKQTASSDASVSSKEVPKKTYASIVAKEPVHPAILPSGNVGPKAKVVTKPAEENAEKLAPVAVKHMHSSVPSNGQAVDNNSLNALPGYSIYLKDLPITLKAQQLEEEFAKFGAIKPRGVQVRVRKTENFCFGFVEFETREAMENAIEASPVIIGGKEVHIVEKKTQTRVINGISIRGDGGNFGPRPAPGRGGGYRGDNYFRGGRGGGEYVNNRGGEYVNNGYKRADYRNSPADYRNQTSYRNQGEYRVQGDYPASGRYQQRASNNNGYQQRVFQNVGDRLGRFNNGPRQPIAGAA